MSSLELDNLLVIGNTSINFLNQTNYKKGALHGDIYVITINLGILFIVKK